jgi:hypothetical protein
MVWVFDFPVCYFSQTPSNEPPPAPQVFSNPNNVERPRMLMITLTKAAVHTLTSSNLTPAIPMSIHMTLREEFSSFWVYHKACGLLM